MSKYLLFVECMIEFTENTPPWSGYEMTFLTDLLHF